MSRINTVKCNWCESKSPQADAVEDWALGVFFSVWLDGAQAVITDPIDLCPECRKKLGGDINDYETYGVKESIVELVFDMAQKSRLAIKPAADLA